MRGRKAKRPSMMMVLTCCLAWLMGATACERSYEVFTDKYVASFSCDVAVPPFNKIQTPGYFLAVRPTPQKDGYRVKEPGGNEQLILYTEVQTRIFRFGLGGLIIGMPYFGEGVYYAYDLGCPHCDRASTLLQVSEEGVATCGKCGNAYDLNNSGVPREGDSRPLYRYRTDLHGGRLMVHN